MESVILNPRYADLLAIVKAARNGAVYGAKVRAPHALVYVQALLWIRQLMSDLLACEGEHS